MLKRTKLSLAVSAAISAGLAGLSPGVGAQTPAAPQTLDRVEITGSNIRRLEGETASPVEVITKEEMVRQGFTSVAEVLREVTANGQGLLSQSFNRAFAGGASGISLRGLGVGSTLVLIDGVRMAAYPISDDAQRPFVDTSSIPFEAVERIEVLLDGASAIYGSDAIAGVVNVILRKNYTGTGLALDAGITTEGDGDTYRLAATHGFGDSKSQYSGFVSGEYRKSKEILLKDRAGEDWTRFDWTPFGGNDLRPGSFIPNAGVTQPFVRTPYLQRRGASTTDPANYAFLDSGCNFTALRSNGCQYEDDFSQIKPETENFNLIGRLNAKLGGGWEAGFTASYFLSKAETVAAPRTMPAGSFGGITALGLGVQPRVVGAIPVFTVPANYPGNPFGAPANVRAFVTPELGRKTEFETAATRLVAQLTGAVAGWELNAQAGYTEVESDIKYFQALRPSALLAALNDQNPATRFSITGGTNPDVLAFVFPTVDNTVKNELSFIQVIGSRDLMQLQGGPMGLALGAGYNYRKLYQPNSPGISTGELNGPLGAYAAGSQSNPYVYGEIVAPVLQNLELNAALRWDDYNTYGGQVVPKVGFKYTPIRQVGIRGTYSEGFRAPSASESGESGSLFGFNSIRDPLLCPVSNPNGTPNTTSPANVPAFCDFAPTYLQTQQKDIQAEESQSWGIGLILEPVPRWLTTIDYYKIELDNQIVTAASLSTYDPLPFAVRTTPQQVTFGDGSTGLSSVGPIQFATSGYVNAQKTETSGIDFATSYTFNPVPAHTINLGLRWSHTLTYDITFEGTKFELAGTHGPEIISGNTGNPRNRIAGTVGWAFGPFTTTLTGNYISSFTITDPSLGIDTCDQGGRANGGTRFAGAGGNNAPIPEQYCRVDSFLTFNLNLQYQINKQLRVQLSGQNIFDEKPPVDLLTYGATGTHSGSNNLGVPYNPSLHQAGANGPFYSIGVTYNF